MMRALLLVVAVFAGAAQASDAPFLWKVQGAKTQHYLMGSVHLLPPSAHPLPAALDAAYSAAETLVFESDLAALSDPKTQMQMLADGQSPEGLSALAGDALYARVQTYANDKGLPPDICENFRAWFCALTLELLSFESSAYRPDLGIDQHYYARAKSVQKTILWFEEPTVHLKLFSGMSDAVANQLLNATLDEAGSSGATPEQLLQAWQSNDVAALDKIVVDFKQEQPQLYERLLAARNRAWLPRLVQMLGTEGTHLIVVGAAHMVGPDGLVALLKAKGYSVTPVAVAIDAAPAEKIETVPTVTNKPTAAP